MLNSYIINRSTCGILAEFDDYGYPISLVMENEKRFYVNKPPIKIVEESFQYIGYDLEGATKGSRNLLNKRKVPIVYSLHSNIILIPVPSLEFKENHYLVYRRIHDITPFDENTTLVYEKRGKLQVGLKFYHCRKMF